MAFNSATGWGNLPNGVFSPTLYSKKVLKFFKTASVVDEISNTDFQGEITQFGDTVRIIQQPAITTFDYERGSIIPVQDVVDDDTTLTIDQGKGFAFAFDDIEVAHMHVNFEQLCTDAGGYALSNSFDINVLTNMTANVATANTVGVSGTEKTVGFGSGNDYTPLDIINELATLLDVANVPATGRFLVASPRFFQQLGREDSKLIDVCVTGDPQSLIRQSKLATSAPIMGFTMFKSNNIPANANSKPQLLAGHVSATSTAMSILQSEVIRNPQSFGNIYRGLMVYGRKVLRPEALALAHVSLGDV